MPRASSIASISGGLIGLFVIIAPLSAIAAESGSGDCQAIPACQQLLEKGIRAFKDNRYDQAIGQFQKAYTQSEDPKLLVFIGRSRFKQGEPKQALELYQQALPTVKNDADRIKLEQYIKEARAALPAGSETGQPPGSGANEELRAFNTAVNPPPPPPKPESKLKPWMWALVGVGAVVVVGTAVGVGVYYGTGTPAADATIRFP